MEYIRNLITIILLIFNQIRKIAGKFFKKLKFFYCFLYHKFK